MQRDRLSIEMIVKLADIATKRRKELAETESVPKCILFALEKNKIPLTSANQSAVASELSRRSREKRASKKVRKLPFSEEVIGIPPELPLYPDAPLGNRPGETHMRYVRGE